MPKLKVALANYLSKRSDNNIYLFPAGRYNKVMGSDVTKNWWKDPENIDPDHHYNIGTIEQRIRKLGKKCGFSAHPHKFRRTCATLALQSGMSLITVSKMLGHESVATTQIYLDISDEDLREEHRKYVV